MISMRIEPWQAILAIVLVSFATVALEFPHGPWLATAPLSLACGVAALALMASAAILSARWPLSEAAFGGLDRMYDAHKWLGISALSLASVHLLFKAGMPGWDTAAIVTLPADWTRLVRQASFVGLMLIIVLSLNRKIPYNSWRWWHRLSGPILLVVVLHALSIKSPIALGSPAGIWIGVLAGLGLIAAAYKLILYPFLSNHAEYEVVAVSPGTAAAQLDFTPTSRPVAFVPGQFGFLRMKVDGLREPHPFTIASGAASDGRISFVIRALGDYTAKLVSEVAPGMRADVYAPYGRFVRRPEASREIWIAGGVGISPFIAWMKHDEAGGFERVTLFYLYTPGRAFPAVETLAAIAQECGVEFVPVSTGVGSPAFVDRFSEIVGQSDVAALDVALCGPKGMAAHVRRLMQQHGVPDTNLRHEIFEFR
jgi:predicted ferric reductase